MRPWLQVPVFKICQVICRAAGSDVAVLVHVDLVVWRDEDI